MYENGYYLEASFILRFLIEVLVKIKYLNKHKEYIDRIWVGKKVKIKTEKGKERNLTIKDMFEEICPGFYDLNYGRIFSGFQHGSAGSLIFRINGRTEETKEYIMGSKWHEKNASLIVNYLTAIGYGYLNNFPKYFQTNFNKMDVSLMSQYINTMNWLAEAINSHKKAFPKSTSWYSQLKGLID